MQRAAAHAIQQTLHGRPVIVVMLVAELAVDIDPAALGEQRFDLGAPERQQRRLHPLARAGAAEAQRLGREQMQVFLGEQPAE